MNRIKELRVVILDDDQELRIKTILDDLEKEGNFISIQVARADVVRCDAERFVNDDAGKGALRLRSKHVVVAMKGP